MIIAIGTDVIEVDRIRRAVDHAEWGERFRQRIFTPGEIAYCTRRARYAESFAARFAAKEAVMKALGVGLGAFGFHDVEVQRDDGGRPSLVVVGAAELLAVERGVVAWQLSLTHTTLSAGAVVVAVG